MALVLEAGLEGAAVVVWVTFGKHHPMLLFRNDREFSWRGVLCLR